ncbi:transposase [Mesorhizobium sp. M1396]|uniref:transposase n=1 Tax=Mesorhizobium sp. M1396 TaxID=2957095 RepID=UPI003335BB9C
MPRSEQKFADCSVRGRFQRRQRRRSNDRLQPMTVTAAGFVMLLTSIPADAMTAEEVLQTYRLRWQVELAFKRLKSGMGIHKLPARDERLARSWLMAHLILALMIDEAVNDVLDSPPCEDETTHGAIAIPLEAA